MGGKHKQAQRTKNNARPSSSGRSAELLGTSINPFVGFSSVKDAGSVPVLPGFSFSSTSNEEMETNIDANFQLVLKKMNKKDSTTKLKALQEFTELVKSSQPEAVKAVLAFWPRLYALLAVDVEHRVREATHNAHRSVVLKVKRNLAPYLKQLAGPWFTSQYDTYPPAASAATLSFEDAFPSNKQQEAIVFCQEDILSYICDNITVQTAQTLSNPKTTSPEEAEAKYERLLISSLQGYTLYLNKLSKEQLELAEEANARIISNPRFWKLSKTKVPLIRAAWFGCVTALCQHAPFVLKNEVHHVTSAVFSNLDETEPAVLSATWEAALFIISNIEDWWKFVNIEKLLLPKLWKILREGGQGSAVVVFPNLLPLVSHFPTTLDTTTLYGNFFENIRIGMKKRTVTQSRSEFGAIATSFIECLRYVTMKNISDATLCESLIIQHLVPTIDWCFTGENIVTKTLFTEISTLVQYWARNREDPNVSNYKQLMECFWTRLEDTIKSSVTGSEQNNDREKCIATTDKQIELLMSLKKNAVNRQKKHFKVKFISPEHKQETSDSVHDESVHSTDSQCLYTKELNQLAYETCCLYLKLIRDHRRNELISALCLLVQHFNSVDLFQYLSTHMNEGSNKVHKLADIHTQIFLSFLRVKSTASESVVDLIFALYNYLSAEEKDTVLASLTKLSNEECFCWCVTKALSHPFCNDTTIQNWLTTDPVSKLLISITESMLNDEVSPDKSLLLKKALTQNVDGEFYISKNACQQIMIIFCGCLLSPSEYQFTIDTCASFAAQLAASVYTEKTLLTYGDQLILALFSLSCNVNYDSDTLSKDTLWEVTTAWQDILSIFTADELTTEFDNIIWKFTKIVHNEFMSNSSELIERLTTVIVGLIKCIQQNTGCINRLSQITNSVLNLPGVIRSVKDQMTDICNCIRIIRGDLSWTLQCPVPENILQIVPDEKLIMNYLMWNRFVINVLTVLFKKTDIQDEETDECDDEGEEPIMKHSTDDVNNLIKSALHSYTVAKIFIDNYKTSKLYVQVADLFDKMHYEYREFISSVIPDEMVKTIMENLEDDCHDTVYVFHSSMLTSTSTLPQVYTRLTKKTKGNVLCLTQLFAKCLTYDHVREPTSKVEKLAVTRALIHCEEIDVQIAEALSAVMAIRGTDVDSLLYNRDISGVNWEQIQIVIEIIRLLTSVIKEKPQNLSGHHWDFVLISLTSWASSTDKSKQKYMQLEIIEFICAVCDLYMAFHEYLCQTTSNLLVEFRDLFAQDVHISLINTWMFVAEQELQIKDTCFTRLPALEIIGNVITHLEPEYLIRVGDPKLPKWQSLVQLCGKLLQSPVSALQLWGYQGLRRILQDLVALDVKSLNQNSPQAYGLMCSQLGHVLTTMQDVVQTMLMDFKLGEDSCRVEAFTDSYTFTFGYLLLWDILLSFCQHASTDLRYQYSDWLRTGEYLKNLLNNVFKLMPTEVLHYTEGRKNIMMEHFTKAPVFAISESSTSEHLEHTVCWVYARTLANLPALVRQWWSDAEPRTAQIVEQVTAAYVSPLLCAQELQDVLEKEKSSKNNMKVKVHPSSREVIASYTVDEARMELIITLPTNYPLGAVQVDCSKQIGGTSQSRNWIMQLTIFLTHQNGRIWDGLSLWKTNLDKKFDGVEECYICFSVLHNATYQLPKLSCQTCRKKFHSPCLNMAGILRNSVNRFTLSLRAFSRNVVRLEKASTPAAVDAEAQIGKLSDKTHRVNELEKRFLVWSGKYKNVNDVPSLVAPSVVEKARNKARIRIANIMILMTALACLGMIISGKRAAERGDTVQKANIEWHNRVKEDALKNAK
ncbi:Listerin E3 ubiquitin protein ligase 1 [Carabus blaptoides fortunei]